MTLLPGLLPASDIHKRLQVIFPEGSANRNNCTWEIAAKTIFVMLYVGAVEGFESWLRPDQVTRMTDKQAAIADAAARVSWAKESVQSSKGEIPGRWYAVNTRESVRDDTLRSGLVANGAVFERQGLPTTSPAGRYALRATFAALFDPALSEVAFNEAAGNWQADNLTAGALARISIVRKGGLAGGDHVMVTFPNGETRRMAPGASSIISKAVIEEFSRRFLAKPALITLSESKDKVIARDDAMAKEIGLNIKADKNLPDIVLADLGPAHPLLVFVEVVATDGPITPTRKEEFTRVAQEAGFPSEHVTFVTAYRDRSDTAFKKTVNALAWETFAWFASEPDSLMRLYQGKAEAVKKLSELT